MRGEEKRSDSTRSSREIDEDEALERILGGGNVKQRGRRKLTKDNKYENEKALRRVRYDDRQERKRKQLEKVFEKKSRPKTSSRRVTRSAAMRSSAILTTDAALSQQLETLAMACEDKEPDRAALLQTAQVLRANHQEWQFRRSVALAEAERLDNETAARLKVKRETQKDQAAKKLHHTLLAKVLQEMIPCKPALPPLPRRTPAALPDEDKNKPRTLLGYFEPAADHHVKLCERTWDRAFLEVVLYATKPISDYDWPSPSQESSSSSSTNLSGIATAKESVRAPLYSSNPDMPMLTGARAAAARANLKDFERDYLCSQCNVPMIVDSKTGALTCEQCGIIKEFVYGADVHLSFNSKQSSSRTGMPYSRDSHFCGVVTKLQGLETTPVPELVINELLKRLHAMGIDPQEKPERITHHFLREQLKLLKMQEYYDKCSQIRFKLTGVSMPKLSEEDFNRLRSDFKLLQKPFDRIRKKYKRNNMLCYRYIAFKLFQRHGLDEWLPHIRLLKQHSNLVAVDRLWEGLCTEVGWEFIPTPYYIE